MELLSVTMNDGVVKRSQIVGKDNSSEDKSNYKIVRSGDLVYNSMRMWQGANGISKYDGIVSPAYTVLKAVEEIDEGYFAALFKTVKLINEFRKNSQGLTSDTWNLKYPQIAGIRICVPKLSEQHKISSFLRLLDKRIDAQRRLVEALKSYKRGVIQGLFSNRVLGNSTYNHWKEYAVKDLFSNIIDKNHPTEDVLTIIQGVGTVPRNSVERRISYDTAYLSTYKRVKQNDFILHLRSFEGGLEIANQDGLVSPAYTILRSKEHLIPSFFYAYFRSYEFISRKLRTTVEGIRDGKSINMDAFWNIKIPCPSLSEQELLSKGLNLTDKMLTAAAQKLSCMQTLKRKLLSDLFI